MQARRSGGRNKTLQLPAQLQRLFILTPLLARKDAGVVSDDVGLQPALLQFRQQPQRAPPHIFSSASIDGSVERTRVWLHIVVCLRMF